MKKTKLERFAALAAEIELDAANEKQAALSFARDGDVRMSTIATERAVVHIRTAAKIREILS